MEGKSEVVALFAKTFAATVATLSTGVLGAIGADGIAVGTVLGIAAGFAGLIVRQVIRNQNAIWDIVRSAQADAARERFQKEYAQWELDKDRFRHGEREDPGPFVPSIPPQLAQMPPSAPAPSSMVDPQ